MLNFITCHSLLYIKEVIYQKDRDEVESGPTIRIRSCIGALALLPS